MFPVNLDVAQLRVILIGNGPATLKRLELLDEAGAKHVGVFANSPSEALKEKAGVRLTERLPEEDQIRSAHVCFMADFDEAQTEALASIARKHGVLVNAEDKKQWCDFFVPAMVRRGELLISVGTGGASPRLARKLKEWLGGKFTEAWAGRLEIIKHARETWRNEGASFKELSEKTDALLQREGWLRDLEK
jgi:precorrin-2 dehydrogenase/sirohydrochlorin ferrochelatase